MWGGGGTLSTIRCHGNRHKPSIVSDVLTDAAFEVQKAASTISALSATSRLTIAVMSSFCNLFPWRVNVILIIIPVSYTHLDVYKRQITATQPLER